MIPKDPLAFARALTDARKQRRLTQVDVADHLGVSGSLVCQWEKLRAEPDPDEVFRMEAILGTGRGRLSQHLGYQPLDDTLRLAYALVSFLGNRSGLEVLKRLAEIHGLLQPDNRQAATRFDGIWWDIPEGNFAGALRIARDYSGLTQHQLARQIGVSQALISQWERGRYQPTADQVFAVERALGRDPGSLSRHLGCPHRRAVPPRPRPDQALRLGRGPRAPHAAQRRRSSRRRT